MPAIRQPQAKKVDAAVALCRPESGDIDQFDRAVAELDAGDRELALRQVGRRLRQAEQQVERLQEVAKALEELREVSGYRAIVLETAEANGSAANGHSVHVALVGQQTRLTAGLLPEMRGRCLALGDEVEVVQSGPQHYAVRRHLGPHRRYGAVALIEEVLEPDLLRIHRGPETVIVRAAGEMAAQLQQLSGDCGRVLGRLVSYDEQLGLAFNYVGPPEREKLIVREFPQVRRADLVLAPRTLRALEERIILPLRHPEAAKAHGVAVASFLILTGAPGVGKTHATRWLATELGRPLYLISGGELASMWYGQTEAALRARIEAAQREAGGAVIVWDEAEALLVERGRSVVGVEDRIVSLMLSATDGFLARGNVLFVLTTNRSDKIDVAIKRSLRAVTVSFERPDAPRTRDLFRLYLSAIPCADEQTREALAQAGTLAIFAEREPIAVAVLRDGSRLPLTRAMAVSGALVRASCEAASRRAFVHGVRGNGAAAPHGITRDDLLAALDDELAAVGQTLTVSNLAFALTLPPGAAEQVVAVTPSDGLAARRYEVEPGTQNP